MHGDIRRRDVSVDYLRVFSLLCIFLLHCSPSNTFNALLQFCVITMMFISGICCHGTTADRNGYLAYVKKRFFRIVVPASVFAFIFGIFVDLFCLISKRDVLFSSLDILSGVLLYKGIGYVWIMRVFFLISLMLPLAQKINSIVNDELFIGCGLIIYALYRALFAIVQPDTVLYHCLYYLVFETIPYFLIWITGMRYARMKRLGKYALVLLCLVGFAFELVQHDWDLSVIRLTKYPPSTAYLAYGLVVTIFFYELLKRAADKQTKHGGFTAIISFLSSKSNELYLIHIPIVYFIFMIEMKHSLPYFLKLAFVILVSIIGLFLYLFHTKKIGKHKIQNEV